MNQIKKYTASLILVLALLAINSSELFHHHSDAGTANEKHCPVCVLVKSVQNSLAAKTFSGLPEISHYNPYTELITPNYSFTPQLSHSSRAPPAVSHI